jgi:hypothetical protein
MGGSGFGILTSCEGKVQWQTTEMFGEATMAQPEYGCSPRLAALDFDRNFTRTRLQFSPWSLDLEEI